MGENLLTEHFLREYFLEELSRESFLDELQRENFSKVRSCINKIMRESFHTGARECVLLSRAFKAVFF